MNRRLRLLSILGLVIASGVFARAFYLQIIGDHRLADLSRRQFLSRVLVQPRRGLILDRNGEAFAVNIESQSLAVNPSKLRPRQRMLRNLSAALGISLDTLHTRLAPTKGFAWVKRHLSESDLAKLKTYGLLTPSEELVEGLWFVRESERAYPQAELATSVVGRVNVDSEGIEGIELWWNDRLRGKGSSFLSNRDGLERPTLFDAAASRNVKDGEPVSLTLDASLQYSVEQHLKDHILRTGASGGTVIVMDASNGELLALANRGTTAGSGARRNRAFTDGYEPGSTLKPLLVATALQNGAKISDRVSGNMGSILIQGRKISEAESHEKFGLIPLDRVLRVSSNVASAQLAIKLGSKKVLEGLRQFGITEKTKIGFPGELAGWLPNESKKIQPLTLATLGFGQGLFTTPIQVVRAYSAFLNGGWLVQPSLIRAPEPTRKPEPPRKIIAKSTIDPLTEALLSVTESEEGTGKKARVAGLRIAGKTGTAQVVDSRTKRYSSHHYIASFVGFAVDVEPKIVVLTLLDRPQGIYYAGETAAPLFSDVMNSVANRYGFPRKNITPTPPTDSSAPLARLPRESDELRVSAALPVRLPARTQLDANSEPFWTFPDFVGQSSREALAGLSGTPIDVEFRGAGPFIVKQSPPAGTALGRGTRVLFELSARRQDP